MSDDDLILVDKREVLRLIRLYWTFSDTQQHTHNWHSMADCVEKIRALPSSGSVAAAVRLAEAVCEAFGRVKHMPDGTFEGMGDVFVAYAAYRAAKAEEGDR